MAVMLQNRQKTNNFSIWFPPNSLYNKEEINLLLAWLPEFKLIRLT